MAMTFFRMDGLPGTEMLPGVLRRAVYLDHVMMTFFEFEPGKIVPEHSHPHEQITYVVRGAMEFTLGDETRTLHAGDGACCPPGVPHQAVVLDAPTLAIDAWYPLREDYT
ncbi:MAG TPA: cupin domain-containing protein [Chloroflexi bacterium]|nr:cupin domain-containing protein [Chloroflexota bacterium]